jgi:hypothetical protein
MAEAPTRRDGHGDPNAPGHRGFRPYDEVMTMVEAPPFPRPFDDFVESVRQKALTPYKGITADGMLVPGLYALAETGISTAPIKRAAEVFLKSLDDFYRVKTIYPIDAPQWRMWDNIGLRFNRHGMWFLQMTEQQREHAYGLLRAALGTDGFEIVRNVMRMNGYLELATRHHHYEGGEFLYRLSIFGTPSLEEPWGFQMDGHHINVNYLVLGDQIVLSPRFLAAEPVDIDFGPHAGLSLFQEEQALGLELMRALTPEQQRKARVVESILTTDFPPERFHFIDQHHVGGQGRDNDVIPYEGIRHDELSDEQQGKLLAIVERYMKFMPPGHREHRIQEIERRFGETYFVWMGGFDDIAPFYYRIHSPVVMLEFDHQSGASFYYPEPNRLQIHTLVRTPNGNDYGKELIRLHLERIAH